MPCTSSTLVQGYRCRAALSVLILADGTHCSIVAALLPHAGPMLDISVVHSMADMEKHLIHTPADIVATRILSEHPDSITTPEALYRATVDQRVRLKDPQSLQLPELAAPRLLWFADGQAALMSLHARCCGGLDIYVIETLPTLVDAILAARNALADALPGLKPAVRPLRSAVV